MTAPRLAAAPVPRRLPALVAVCVLGGGFVAVAGMAHAASAASSATTCANRGQLGQAQEFSEFSLGDAFRGQPGGVDNEARSAYGGNATFEHFYNGSYVPTGQVSLVVQGDVSGSLSLGDGSLGIYGGTSTAVAADNPTAPTANLSRSATLADVVDFAATGATVKALSTAYGAEPTSADAQVSEDVSSVTLTGTDPTCNVFDLSAGAFATAVNILVHVPVGSATLINVPDVSLPSTALDAFQYWDGEAYEHGAHYGSKNEELVQNATIVNFPNATTLGFTSAAVATTVLAPFANFTFDDGQVDGAVIAKTIRGGFESEDTGIASSDVLPFSSSRPASSSSGPVVTSSSVGSSTGSSSTATVDVLPSSGVRASSPAGDVGSLPFTGADGVGGLLAAGEATMLTGGILAFVLRRRRRA